jgi:hypothetical protein
MNRTLASVEYAFDERTARNLLEVYVQWAIEPSKFVFAVRLKLRMALANIARTQQAAKQIRSRQGSPQLIDMDSLSRVLPLRNAVSYNLLFSAT